MEKLPNRKWTVLDSHYVAKEGDWFTVRKERVQLPSGVVVPAWYIMEFPDWVNIVAVTKEGRFVLISQYRHALGETHYELCAGVVDKTDESPMAAAKRELMEETGFGGGEWMPFMCLSPNPTNHTNHSHTFLAIGVEKLSEPHQEPSEDIQTYLCTKEEVYDLLKNDEIVQALHAAPLWKYFAEHPE